jgi:hypothetical protein
MQVRLFGELQAEAIFPAGAGSGSAQPEAQCSTRH